MAAPQFSNDRAAPRSPAKAIGCAVIALAIVTVYVLRLDGAAGLMVDDAWYILLAKALADGSGYRLISSATPAILPSYPPGFPAILSLVFRTNSEFPDNVWLLKTVSIAAMIGVGLVTYLYAHRDRGLPRQLAAGTAIAVATTPAFVFLATSTVMSECVFTLTQLATVVLVHRSGETRSPRSRWTLVIFAAIAAAGSVLLRSAAVALVVAAALWFFKERLWKCGLLFAAVVGVTLAPWALYARAHTPTSAERAAHGGAVVYGYMDQFWMRWAGTPEMGEVTAADLPVRVQTNVIDVFGRDVGGILMPVLFRGPAESGQEVLALGGTVGIAAASMGGATATIIISSILSSLIVLGFIQMVRRLTVAELLVPISLAIVLLWPFWSFRFVLPLTPFLFLYFLRGLHALASVRVARIALLSIVGLNVYDNAGYIVRTRGGASSGVEWLAHARDVDDALAWMSRSLAPQGGLATTNPALVYLRTGRKSIAFDNPRVDWSSWRQRGVRYVACLLPLEVPASAEYRVLYKSPGRLWIVEI